MVKLIIFCTKMLIATTVALLFASCNVNNFTGIKGSGNVQTQKRAITEKFTKISVSRGLEVIVEQANTVSVEVKADQNLLGHITTKVENGTLVITSDENIYSATTQTIRVKMPVIEALEAGSGSNIKSNGTLKSTATATTISVKTSSGSEINTTIEMDEIIAESRSGSTITLSGKTLKFNPSSSSGSELNAENLLANDVIAEASSGSSIAVHPLVSLNAKASSGANIDYTGIPKNISQEETSGGSVSKK